MLVNVFKNKIMTGNKSGVFYLYMTGQNLTDTQTSAESESLSTTNLYFYRDWFISENF